MSLKETQTTQEEAQDAHKETPNHNKGIRTAVGRQKEAHREHEEGTKRSQSDTQAHRDATKRCDASRSLLRVLFVS